mmetsp:Transcript_9730/g.11109  ORF Transcript_9730/g.11109 Transcript_9730/m.11109 type:complete len:336 (-) Transcript_9730:12-1019(-)
MSKKNNNLFDFAEVRNGVLGLIVALLVFSGDLLPLLSGQLGSKTAPLAESVAFRNSDGTSSLVSTNTNVNPTMSDKYRLSRGKIQEKISAIPVFYVTLEDETYTSVLKALAHNCCPTTTSADSINIVDTATSLLNEMINSKKSVLEPSTIHYNIVLDVYAKSSYYQDKAVQAYDLYEQMIQRNNSTKTVPNIITYNSVLCACANTFGSPVTKRNAFDITLRIYNKIIIQKVCKPDSITFLFLLKALRKLGKNNSKYFIQSFQYCCELGLVNDIVLNQVKLVASNGHERTKDLFPSILENNNNNWSAAKLPSKWTNKALHNNKFDRRKNIKKQLIN